MLRRTNERTNERCPGRADATGARTGGGDGDGGGEGITYWAEKAKKRMTALSVVARSSAEKDGATRARIPAVKLMMLSKPRHFSIDSWKEREGGEWHGQSRGGSMALGARVVSQLVRRFWLLSRRLIRVRPRTYTLLGV